MKCKTKRSMTDWGAYLQTGHHAAEVYFHAVLETSWPISSSLCGKVCHSSETTNERPRNREGDVTEGGIIVNGQDWRRQE